MEAKAAGRLSRELKGVEDRHEALSIFFDMKVTVRGSGEEEGLEKQEAGIGRHTHMWDTISI